MAGQVLIKPGVQFTRIAPAGARILEAIKATAQSLEVTLVITCACEGHDETDPHTLGEAYDLRTHDFTPERKQAVLRELMEQLQRGALDTVQPTSRGLATLSFFGWIEHPGEVTEHLHVQRRSQTHFSIQDYFAA